MSRPYHIIAPGFCLKSAGIRVLYKLHQLLQEAGHQSTISCDQPAPEKEETVCVYPEIVPGNPLDFKHVARWDLNFPVHRYAESEKVFYYNEEFHNERSQATHRLQLFFTEPFFCLPSGGERMLDCFFQGKGDVRQRMSVEGMTEITMGWPGSREELAMLFQSARYFYTCGHTSLSLEATLCGCEVVFCDDLAPRPIPTREEMNKNQTEDLAWFISLTQGEWGPPSPNFHPMNPGWESWVR